MNQGTGYHPGKCTKFTSQHTGPDYVLLTMVQHLMLSDNFFVVSQFGKKYRLRFVKDCYMHESAQQKSVFIDP